MPAVPAEPIDTTGAGDAFVGAAVARLGLGTGGCLGEGLVTGALTAPATGAHAPGTCGSPTTQATDTPQAGRP